MTEGEILINGVNIRENFEEAVAHIGGIIENPDMYKYLTGYENLLHFARMHKGIGKKRIDEMVRLVGLENRINDKVKTYSLGMRQCLGLAQAMLHSPSVFVLDEPTNGLDPAGINMLMLFTLSFMISTVFRNGALAIGMGIFLNFAGGMIVDAFRESSWIKYFLFANTNLGQYIDGIPAVEGMTMTFSIIVLIVYFVVFNIISWSTFTKRDVAV